MYFFLSKYCKNVFCINIIKKYKNFENKQNNFTQGK